MMNKEHTSFWGVPGIELVADWLLERGKWRHRNSSLSWVFCAVLWVVDCLGAEVPGFASSGEEVGGASTVLFARTRSVAAFFSCSLSKIRTSQQRLYTPGSERMRTKILVPTNSRIKGSEVGHHAGQLDLFHHFVQIS